MTDINDETNVDLPDNAGATDAEIRNSEQGYMGRVGKPMRCRLPEQIALANQSTDKESDVQN